MSLLKIGSAEVNATLVKAASALRDLSAENERLRAVIAENDRRDYAEKIASSAVHRGIMDPEEAKDYANSLTESDKDLSIVCLLYTSPSPRDVEESRMPFSA